MIWLTSGSDFIDSFLRRPDKTTTGLCLLSKSGVHGGYWAPKKTFLNFQTAQKYQIQNKHWFNAASSWRWVSLVSGAVIALTVSGVFLGMGMASMRYVGKSSIASLWSLGFGSVNAYSIAKLENLSSSGQTPSLMTAVLIANLPQGVLSILYLTYNSLFTCMSMEKEWSEFAEERHTLPVSSPTGKQRSAFYLQLPYRYAVPLIFLSGVMHWLVSQSIFLAQITSYDENGEVFTSRSSCGYSCIALIFTIILGTLMLAGILLLGMRKQKPGLPTAGHCSAVISAACHTAPGEGDISTSSLMWGVISEENGIGHCAFSAREVRPPRPGELLM